MNSITSASMSSMNRSASDAIGAKNSSAEPGPAPPASPSAGAGGAGGWAGAGRKDTGAAAGGQPSTPVMVPAPASVREPHTFRGTQSGESWLGHTSVISLAHDPLAHPPSSAVMPYVSRHARSAS